MNRQTKKSLAQGLMEKDNHIEDKLNEWGIPDWRDAASYGKVGAWSMNRWRWEFYRRREDLREYFDRWAEVTYEESLEVNEGRRPSDSGFLAYGREEDAGRGIKDFDYSGVPNPRIGAQPEISIMPFSKLVYNFRFYDPAKRIPSSRGVLEVVGQRTAKEYRLWLENHEVAVKFDVNEPLAAQIETARKVLRKKQKELHGKLVRNSQHKHKWLGYLRTIDARADGATWREIASIHPETAQTEQSARDKWNSANALRFNF